MDGIVPIDQLANYKSLKKKMTDEEFQLFAEACYVTYQFELTIDLGIVSLKSKVD